MAEKTVRRLCINCGFQNSRNITLCTFYDKNLVTGELTDAAPKTCRSMRNNNGDEGCGVVAKFYLRKRRPRRTKTED